MEDGNISTLVAALKLDENPLTNQLLYLEELNNADGSFILSTLIKYQIDKNQNIILVLCHNTLGHFQAISQKLGYNLKALEQSGKVYVIEVLNSNYLKQFLLKMTPYQDLYCEIKNQFYVLNEEKGVCVIVENLSDLMLCDAQDSLTFVTYLRGLINKKKNSSVVLSIHNFLKCSDFNFITKSIRHFADIVVTLNDLQTGRANDVTGHLTIIRRENNYKKFTSEYQYQLLDKRINVFTPGLKSVI